MHLTKVRNIKTSYVFGYRPEIDGLRTMPILAVTINHF